MDPLSALSIATSTVQFLDFGCKLFSKSKEIYTSADGALIDQRQSEDACKRLKELTECLKKSLRVDQNGRLSPEDTAIHTICNDCVEISNEMLMMFEKLRVHDGVRHRRWESFRKALISVWSKKKVNEMASRLQRYKQELGTHILVSLSQKLDLSSNDRFALHQGLQSNVENLVNMLDSMKKEIKESLDKNPSKKDEELDNHTDNLVLASLRFQTMDLRFEEVSEAHQSTFQWVYQNERDGRKWGSLSDWLTSDGQIYWVNGKAGSGKSTLMRFIYRHSETLKLLQKWSDGKEIMIAKYFFWNSGSKEQRSQAGLFRSLLFEVLNQRRDLIRHIFPDRWAQKRSLGLRLPNEKILWSLPVLKTALTDLTQMATDDLRMCFFVDGLDECEGTEESSDHRAMGDFLKKISTFPFVKVCLSSRPWHLFEEIFGRDSGLRLQDLTRHDMRVYVTDKLTENGRMKALEELGPVSATKFVNEILDKAEGVFLWVTLVLKSVINGIGRHESISDLEARIRRAPSDLLDLYRHMFARIDCSDMQKAAQIIQIFLVLCTTNIPGTVICLGLALETRYDQAVSRACEEMSHEELILLYRRTASTLKSTCQGLIEIHDFSGRPVAEDYVHKKLSREELLLNELSYIHHTVNEFFMKEGMQEEIRLQTRSLKDFSPEISVLIGITLLCKISKPEVFRRYYLGRFFPHMVLFYGHVGETCANDVIKLRHHHLLDQLHDLWYNIGRYNRASLCNADFVNTVPDKKAQNFEYSFLYEAMLFGNASWIIHRITLIKRFPELRIPLLNTFWADILQNYEDPRRVCRFFEVATFFLRYGTNPNDLGGLKDDPYTIWQFVLKGLNKSLMNTEFLADTEYLQVSARLIITCLEQGADTEAKVIPFLLDEAGVDPLPVTADTVIERLEELEVKGSSELRQLFERNRANKFVNTSPSIYREPSPVKLKRPRATGSEEQERKNIMRPQLSY